MARVVVIAGMSGAGRTVAAAAFEDAGWFVIDNLPAALVGTVGNMAVSAGGDYEKIALVIGGYSEEMAEQVQLLKDEVEDCTLIFLEASDDVIVTRFKTTKRRHPFAGNKSLAEAISQEKQELQSARQNADLVIDTTSYNPYELKERVINDVVPNSSERESRMKVTLLSFGFKNGAPRDADLMFDCRFMPNPHWVPELKAMTGREKVIQDYVMAPPVSEEFVGQLKQMLQTLIPAYSKEGKSYLTIAFGCTGGKHRSVSVAEILSSFLEDEGWSNTVRHRDVEKR